MRADGLSAVVHAANNGRLHVLLLSGGLNPGDIHGTAPLVANKVSAYRCGDNVNAGGPFTGQPVFVTHHRGRAFAEMSTVATFSRLLAADTSSTTTREVLRGRRPSSRR